MKKNIYILIACLFTAMLAGCSVNEEGIYGSFPYLEIDVTPVTLSKSASTEALTYESNRDLKVKVESNFGTWLTATANDGQIVVARIGDEATVKRLRRRNGEIWLMPENDAYEPIDGSEAELIGLVKAVVREY